MISPWTIYWIMQLDSVKISIERFTACSVALSGISVLLYMLSHDPSMTMISTSKSIKCSKIFVSLSILLVTLNTFIPSTKTAATILTVPMIVNNEQFQADLTDIYSLGMEKIKDTLTDESKEK